MAGNSKLHYKVSTSRITGFLQGKPISASVRVSPGIAGPSQGAYLLLSPVNHPIYGVLIYMVPSNGSGTATLSAQKVEIACEKVERVMKYKDPLIGGTSTSSSVLPSGNASSGYIIAPTGAAIGHLRIVTGFDDLAAGVRVTAGASLEVSL